MADLKSFAEQLVNLSVKEGVAKAEAEEVANKLKEAGADVEIG